MSMQIQTVDASPIPQQPSAAIPFTPSNPVAGGYYVTYADGASFSAPANIYEPSFLPGPNFTVVNPYSRSVWKKKR